MQHTAVAIPGDGIGPEVLSAVQPVLEAADAPIHFEVHYAGQTALEAGERTADLGGSLGTEEFAHAVTRRLQG